MRFGNVVRFPNLSPTSRMTRGHTSFTLFSACLIASVSCHSSAPRERPLSAGASCNALAALALPHATITVAQVVAAGAFSPSEDGGNSRAYAALPAFCRVVATLAPTADSDIEIELWAPVTNWNGKFEGVGNGAFSGSIPHTAMATALARGYATGATNTGHSGNSARFAVGHPEKVNDFGWRAVHEMTVASKALVTAYYGVAPAYSYWVGCSAGGRQALVEAQRFPADFDGIVAGSPGFDWTGRASQAVRVAKVLEAAPEARLLQPERALLHAAALAACDASDGVKDGVIENPRRCNFDPGVLLCKSAERSACLTAAQVATARLIYSSAVNRTIKREIAGLEPGSELGWTDLGWSASARATGLDQFRYVVFGDSNWTIQSFDADADIARAEEADHNTLNALDANLRPFIDRGGKLIQYHGWSDPQIAPATNTQYYDRVVAELGGASRVVGSYRLFMAPGMGHCGGGEGPNSFNMLAAMERWVEHGTAPDEIIASHATNGRVDRTRPLCPYPRQAVYRGAGSTGDAASFVCRAP
jgi:feruloyl esterase